MIIHLTCYLLFVLTIYTKEIEALQWCEDENNQTIIKCYQDNEFEQLQVYFPSDPIPYSNL